MLARPHLAALVLLGGSTLALVTEPAPVALAPTRAPAPARSPGPQDMPDVVVTSEVLEEGLAVLFGAGGNILVSHGDDGVLFVDDQFAALTDRHLAAVAELGGDGVDWVVNTHWHGDHVGGNENLGRLGAVIVAHENVRERMGRDHHVPAQGRDIPAAPEVALPVVTFDGRLVLHRNGQTLELERVADAHTDGDVLVHVLEADVWHTGDTFFNGMYPYIDAYSGGSIHGMIEVADHMLARSDDGTRFVPGHGAVATRDDLHAYREMLVTARDRIQALLDEGLGAEEVVAAKPTRELDERWGGGFLDPDRWVGLVVGTMAAGGADAER